MITFRLLNFVENTNIFPLCTFAFPMLQTSSWPLPFTFLLWKINQQTKFPE